MPRRREVPKREILPDPKYGNVELSKFMNVIMEGGKKAVAERIIYGALAALAQTDIKRLVAYSSVSHMGFIVLGTFSLNSTALDGASIQMLNHGLTFGSVLEINFDNALYALFGNLEVGNVALFFQDARDFRLQLRSWDVDLRVARLECIPHPGQHVCDRITNHS